MAIEAQSGNEDYSFPTTLRQFREREGTSRNHMAHQIGVDPSYLTRLEHGHREPPRYLIIEAIARYLKLEGPDQDLLFMSANFLPPSFARVIASASLISEVAAVLNSPLSEQDMADYQTVVTYVSRRWRGASQYS